MTPFQTRSRAEQRKFCLRGLAEVNSDALLLAARQTLKCLLSRHAWDRRPFPSGERESSCRLSHA
jgi:hypothetical protein